MINVRAIGPSRAHQAERVIRRYAADVIPKKWFPTKLAELKALLKTPHHESVSSWGWVLDDRVESYFKRFQSEFDAMVGSDSARALIKASVDFAIEYVSNLSSRLRDLGRQGHFPVASTDPVERLAWYGWSEATSQMEKTCPTIGDLFKYSWSIDKVALEKLAQKIVKKASPAELTAILGDNDSDWRVKHEFLTRVGFNSAAAKLAKKSKLDWTPLTWFSKMQELVVENYASGVTTAYRQFDLDGMKIVVDDATVTDADIREYIGYLREAHARLKIRGLESAWYGVCFIKCAECGGQNHNTGGGVGGHYFTGPDVVWIYQRPAKFIVELVVHELGHRYWFKQMKPEQRQRFKALVKARTVPRPHDAPKDAMLYGEEHLRKHKDAIHRAERSILELIEDARTPTLTSADKALIISKIRSLSEDPGTGPRGLGEAMKHPDVAALAKQAWSAKVDVKWAADDLDRTRPERLDSWARDLREKLARFVRASIETLDLALKVHNADAEAKLAEHPDAKKWQQSYFDNPAPVEAVSDYGKSDIDEAFAEVFAHYVLNFDITRDQMESFRSVLSKPGSHRRQAGRTQRVVARYVAGRPRNIEFAQVFT